MKDSIEQRVRNALLIETRLERFKAVNELQENMPDEALQALVILLKSPDEKLRRRAGSALSTFRASISQQAEAIADELLHNPDSSVRLCCASVLMPVRSPVVDRAYAKAVFDPAEKVAEASCGEAGWRATTEGIEALFQVLANRSWHVRFAACAALVNQKLADQRVVATLEALAREPEAVEEDRISMEMATSKVWKSLMQSVGKEGTVPPTVGTLLERARALANTSKK